MIKPKIGAALCLISAIAAAIIYFWIDIKLSEHFTVLMDLRFCRVYYPLLCLADWTLLAFLFLKSHALKSLRLSGGSSAGTSRIFAHPVIEAVLMEGYVALNVFFAIRLYQVIDTDIYVPMMFAKAVFFAVLYQVQACFAFVKRKTAMRIIALCGIAVLAAAVYLGLRWHLKNDPLGDSTLYLNILISGYLSNIDKTWPESNYWLASAAFVGVECLLPLFRLIGLALYNTKYRPSSQSSDLANTKGV